MDEADCRSIILHYGREKFYHTMHTYAVEAISKYPGEQKTFRLLNGIALVLGNRVQEAIRELTPMQNDREVNLPTILALIYAHKRCAVVDKEAILALDQKMKEERKKVTHVPVYYAAVFLFLSGKLDKAREYAEKALKMSPNFSDALSLKAWADLTAGQRIDQNVFDMFEKAASLDAQLGQVRYYQVNNDYENAIALLNKLAVRYSDQKLPLVEKMKTELANWRWENAKETAQRILGLDPVNIDALQIKILVTYCFEGNVNSCVLGLEQLFNAVRKQEPANAEMFLQIGQLFARVAFRNPLILEQSLKFVEKANLLCPSNARILTELGFQWVPMENFKDAVKYFKQATKVDDSATEALCGLTLCQMSESGPSEQVAQQIEFLMELQGTNKIPLVLLMSARMNPDAEEKIALLVEASEWHIKNLRTVSFGTDYLRLFNPTLLQELATDLLQLCPIRSVKQDASGAPAFLHKSLRQTLNILEMIVKSCPGVVEAVNLLAKVQFLCGDSTAALSTLQRTLQEVDPTNTDAHLLISQINIQQGQLNRAKQNLEICLGHNFRVRDSAMYHLLNGIVQKNAHQLDEALNSFGQAMELSGTGEMRKLEISSSKEKSTGPEVLGLSDQVTLYVEMANTLSLLNQHSEATKTMDEALLRYVKTPEEGRLLIANADLLLAQGKVDLALNLLGNIQCGEPYYMEAKMKMANIFLTKKKDRLSFAQCFRELVDNCPGGESQIMLGDAYMSIQDPDRALDAYKTALKLSPRDAAIAGKLGRAYVKTHQYTKAINFYKEVTGNREHSALKLDLADLYLKLKQYRNAEEILIGSLEQNKSDNSDLEVLQLRTKQLLLLARVRERSGNLADSLETLKEARDNQSRIQKRIAMEQSVVSPEQQQILSKISSLLAEQSIRLRENNEAVKYYKEAIKHTPDDISLQVALARLFMQMNGMDQCQQVCDQILQVDSKNEAASVMMADLSFRKMDFENAAYHFSQLLLLCPTYWTALARLVEVTRRSGKIANIPEFIKRGEQSCEQPVNYEAGLNFCKGLYEWYTGNPNMALRLFNNARRDAEWGKQAVFNMVEICLNPDGELPNENQLDSQNDEARESQQVALKTAERLLKELQPRGGALDNESLNYHLLENFIHLATKQRYLVEQALQAFMGIAAQDEYKDHVGPILGVATAHVLLKQSQRAKNQLKRVSKHQWTFEDAEYLERCWLLLADLYIQGGKLDMASELLVRVLDHNKSCVKAHELCGMISEKEALPKAASIHYDLAWKFSGKSKPAIGYRLAYNYMKAKRYPDAIDVCQQVLKLNPDFAAIKKDILDKSRNNLKL